MTVRIIAFPFGYIQRIGLRESRAPGGARKLPCNDWLAVPTSPSAGPRAEAVESSGQAATAKPARLTTTSAAIAR